ncbi:hypothetical protein U1Q18_003850, partial [Sarracenia purpurea var. burkii]
MTTGSQIGPSKPNAETEGKFKTDLGFEAVMRRREKQRVVVASSASRATFGQGESE